jgi:hypothetical protein
MPQIDLTALDLDWKLACQRVAMDARDDFWPDPLSLVDTLGKAETVASRHATRLKSYHPRKAASYPLPKANFTVRDSIYLRPIDRLVYQALVDKLAPIVDSQLLSTVYSHRLRSADAKWMFHSGVTQWKRFFDAVKGTIVARPGSYLVVTDVAQYFEAIRFRPLKFQLEKLSASRSSANVTPIIDALITCLNGWTPYDSYGLVQNTDPSSFLGNALMDKVDKAMFNEGYTMFRYMDDLRIVVPNEAAARKALLRLVLHLREIGLGLNSAKTFVIGPQDLLMNEHVVDDDPEIALIEKAIASKDAVAIQGAAEMVFRRAETLLAQGLTSERVFRFCLNRINSLRLYKNLTLPDSNGLTSTVLQLLVRRPAETDSFCRYLETAPFTAEHIIEFERLLSAEPLCVYVWQNFLLWRVLTQRKVHSDVLKNRAHALISADMSSPEAGAAALFLGATGSYADRDALKSAIRRAPLGLVSRCVQVALQELLKAERTPLYNELSERDDDAATLAEYINSMSEPRYVDAPAPVSIEDLADAMPSVYA